MAKHEDHTLLALDTSNDVEHNKLTSLPQAVQKLSKASLYKEYRNIRKRETRFQMMLDESIELIFAIDPDKRIQMANTSAEDFFKNQMECPLRLGDQFLLGASGQIRNLWSPILEKAQLGFPFESRLEIASHNKVYHFQLRFCPQKNDQHQLEELWFFCRDVSAETLALETIDKKEAMLESISNSVQEGIFRSNIQEGIIYVNQAFARMFGYDSTEEIMKVEPYDLYMDPTRRDDFVEIVKKKDSFFNEEVEFKRKDGSSFWGLMSSVPVIDKSGLRYHDGAIRDVTQLREAERRLKDNYEELQKVNRELDRFVYSTSHDLRAPLVSIAGLINITRIEENEELRQKYLKLMETSIQKLDEFIKDIIGYSRNSRLELKCEPVNFSLLFERSIDSLKPKDGSCTIKTSIDIDSKGVFYSDLFRLNTICNNLLSNAFRYFDPQKGESFIEIKVVQDEQRARISIRDNGIGIEEKYQDKIFQMFFRATTQSQGSGIGLYIVKEAIEKLGGTIAVISTFQEGTEFVLEIPQGKQ